MKLVVDEMPNDISDCLLKDQCWALKQDGYFCPLEFTELKGRIESCPCLIKMNGGDNHK